MHPNLSLADPDPKEVARQISLITHDLFCAINPRELYSAISTRSLSFDTPGLNEMYEFGEKLKLLVAATILEGDKRSRLKIFERMIEIGRCLFCLKNFEAVSWFVSAFQMKCIRNLPELRAAMNVSVLDRLISGSDWRRTSFVYTEKIRRRLEAGKIAVPNTRYELYISAESGFGGPEFVEGTVNWAKRNRIAKLVVPFSRFRKVRYNFHAVSQIQAILKRGSRLSKEKLNEMSIAIRGGSE
jgi:hypothetical protein